MLYYVMFITGIFVSPGGSSGPQGHSAGVWCQERGNSGTFQTFLVFQETTLLFNKGLANCILRNEKR